MRLVFCLSMLWYLVFGCTAQKRGIENFNFFDAYVFDSCNVGLDNAKSDSVYVIVSSEENHLNISLSNSTKDSIYVFGTLFVDTILFNNPERFYFDTTNSQLLIDFVEQYPVRDSYWAGLKQYQFVRLCPNSAINLLVSWERIFRITQKQINTEDVKVLFSYYNGGQFYEVVKIKGEMPRFVMKYNGNYRTITNW